MWGGGCLIESSSLPSFRDNSSFWSMLFINGRTWLSSLIAPFKISHTTIWSFNLLWGFFSAYPCFWDNSSFWKEKKNHKVSWKNISQPKIWYIAKNVQRTRTVILRENLSTRGNPMPKRHLFSHDLKTISTITGLSDVVMNVAPSKLESIAEGKRPRVMDHTWLWRTLRASSRRETKRRRRGGKSGKKDGQTGKASVKGLIKLQLGGQRLAHTESSHVCDWWRPPGKGGPVCFIPPLGLPVICTSQLKLRKTIRNFTFCRSFL